MTVENHTPEHIPARLAQDIRLCFAFFTRLPVTWPEDVPFSRLGPAMWAFPLVGWVVGAISTLVGILSYLLIRDSYTAVIIMLATGLLLTGAMHEDGLADVADGFGGGSDRAAKLTIMKDSRIGTYGVLALMLAVLLKLHGLVLAMSLVEFSIIMTLMENQNLYANEVDRLIPALGLLLGAAPVSRALAVAGMLYLSPAKEDGMGAEAGRVTFRTLFAAILIATLPLFLFISPLFILGGLVAGGLGTALIMVIAHRQIGGYTGDVIGAIQIVAEILFLFTVVRLISLPI